MSSEAQIRDHLNFLYGTEIAASVFEQIKTRLDDFQQRHPNLLPAIDPNRRVTQADSILITYGDQIVEPGQLTLRTLADVFDTYLKDIISTVHLLPFYPYSSDDGFSVINYKAVNPALGDWPDVAHVGQNFRLMFDAVINHISAKSDWFQNFLQDIPPYTDYFITEDPQTDLSTVIRPRTSPLLTPFETSSDTKYVWTTFSADQIDLNYKNTRLLLEIIDVLLFYVANGAEFIRLDAIAFLWKEVGTSCIHLPQTHRVIQLFRAILDVVAPNVMLITETNVPHRENISYFGDGQNEAQMVYQFSLAPLILHAFHTGDATALQSWAAGLEMLPEPVTFFNFIASHDGIGLRPAEGILTPDEIQHLVDKTLAHRGLVSYKTNPDGSQSAYELNITLFDALSSPSSDEPEALQIDRFIASQAIMLAMVGVPGIYIHSLFGSSNDLVSVEETGRARSINRQKWLRVEVEAVMANPNSRSHKIFQRYVSLLKVRANHPVFHPNAEQQVIGSNPALFTLLRTAPDKQELALCIHNISDQSQHFTIDNETLRNHIWHDKLGASVALEQGVPLDPYEVVWMFSE